VNSSLPPPPITTHSLKAEQPRAVRGCRRRCNLPIPFLHTPTVYKARMLGHITVNGAARAYSTLFGAAPVSLMPCVHPSIFKLCLSPPFLLYCGNVPVCGPMR
jgi:hypothetical protein